MDIRIISSPTIMGDRALLCHLRDERRSFASSESAELSEKTREEFSGGMTMLGKKSERFYHPRGSAAPAP